MGLRGRLRGTRNHAQQVVWTENAKKIVFALMDKSPSSAKLKYLEQRTGLSRQVLNKHLSELVARNVVVKDEDNVYRLNPSFHLEHRSKPIPSTISIPDIGLATLVVRAKATNPFSIQIYSNNELVYVKENTATIASTIPVNASEIKIGFTGSQLDSCQVMVFKINDS